VLLSFVFFTRAGGIQILRGCEERGDLYEIAVLATKQSG
jgi:hypothetical protein